MKNYYEILGVDPDADENQIRRSAWLKIKKLNEVFLVLKNNYSRINYDFYLKYLEYIDPDAIFNNRLNYEALLNNNTEYNEYEDEHSDEENHKTYYEILEISHNATLSEIYIAFEDRKQEITDAYHTLRKKWKRKKYNWALEFSQMSSVKKLIFIHYLTSFIVIGISGIGYIIWRLYELFK